MKSVLSANRIKSVENYTINRLGIDALILMERAAVEVAFSIMEKYPVRSSKILIVCGSGNNGADGLCVARILYEYGYSPIVYSKTGKTELHNKQYEILKRISGEIHNDEQSVIFKDISELKSGACDVVVDALYGIGINRPLSEEDVKIIDTVNNTHACVYSIDVPSGLDSTNGSVYNACINADYTICLGRYKKGLLTGKGPDYSGEIIFKSIGLFADNDPDDYLMLDKDDISKINLIKRPSANKGTYGKTLVAAGSESVYGACFLAAKSALMSGAGMVKVLTHENNRHSLEHDIPEAMFSFYEDEIDAAGISGDIEWCNTIVVGPGIGTGEISRTLLRRVIENINGSKILILDADAINILADDYSVFKLLTDRISRFGLKCVITPHKKELSRLKGLFEKEESLVYSEEDFCKMLFGRYSIVVINKDANTRIYGEKIYINTSGNEGMATAGSGDVLSGILGGLSFRLHEEFGLACAVSVWVHGTCGDLFVKDSNSMTLTATDLIQNVGKALDFLT